MKKMNCKGVAFGNLSAVEILTDFVRMVIVTTFGPRIAYFGLRDREPNNILLWQPGKYTRGDWDLRGGARVWVAGVGADEREDTYMPDNGECTVEIGTDFVRVTGAKCEANQTRRGMVIRQVSEAVLQVESFVTNVGPMLYDGGIWAIACTVPSKVCTYAIAIGAENASWNAFNMVVFDKWAGHGQAGFDDDQVSMNQGFLLVDPVGIETKRMVESRLGIIAMSDSTRGLTFAKRVTHNGFAKYPGACNTAFYIGPENFMVEMETMGEQGTILPGQAVWHVEQWSLTDQVVQFQSHSDVVRLFD